MKLKITADSEAGKQEADIGHEYAILSTTVRSTAIDKQKYETVAKLSVPSIIKIFENTKKYSAENGELILLILVSDQQTWGDVNYILTWQKFEG
jgi:hypothetical protein